MGDFGGIYGQEIRAVTLEDGDVSVTILNFGCITRDWLVPVGDRRVSAVLGYAGLEAYRTDPWWMGAIVGRVANRIGGARFCLDGTEYRLAANEGRNILHGGARGLGRRLWAMEIDGRRSVRLKFRSPDGDMGFPGAVDFTVTIRLAGHCLSYEMTAVPDRPTPISLAQHSYYNLAGSGSVGAHQLHIAARGFTPTDAGLVPDGTIMALDRQRFDFRQAKYLKQADPNGLGFDVNLVLEAPVGDDPHVVMAIKGGLGLRLWTDQPGMQLFSARRLSGPLGTLRDQNNTPAEAICLEPQAIPNAVNLAQFPSVICTPDQPYRQILRVEIADAGAAGVR